MTAFATGWPGWIAARLLPLLLLLLPVQALAHAALIESRPAEGQVLDTAPATLDLRFAEPVRPLVARLTGPDGRTRLLPEPQSTEMTVSYPLPPLSAQGSYLLSWRVTSADGHPLAGASVFSIGAPSTLNAAGPEAPRVTRIAVWGARAVLLAGLIFAVGARGAALVFGTPPLPAAARRLGYAGLVALPVAALAQGLELLGEGPAALASAAPWREALSGAPALALAFAGLALLSALALRARAGGVLAVAALALSAGAAGHAATAPPQALMRPMVAAHVLAGALWLGALIPLLRGGPGALARFSARIPLVLALLIASGIALIVVQLAGPRPALTTAYGQVLMAKLGLVAGLLLLALYNRLRLAPRAEAGDAAPLARAIRAEIVLGLMIVGTLSLWRFTPPPRSLPPPPTEVSVPFAAGPLSLTVTLGADRPGPVPLRLSDLRLDGRPFTPREIEVALSKPAYWLGPFRRSLHPTGPQADAGTFLLPIDGVWLLELQVLVNDFRRERVLDLVTIDPAAAP